MELSVGFTVEAHSNVAENYINSSLTPTKVMYTDTLDNIC